MRMKFALFGILTFLALWSCHLGPEDDKTTFDLAGDTAWTQCDTVMVGLLDGEGLPVDTLFKDSLGSLEQLKALDAGKYKGGKGAVHIIGSKGGGLCFEQKRSFQTPGGQVKVDTLRDPNAAVASLSLDPESVVLDLGSPAALIALTVDPVFADPDVA